MIVIEAVSRLGLLKIACRSACSSASACAKSPLSEREAAKFGTDLKQQCHCKGQPSLLAISRPEQLCDLASSQVCWPSFTCLVLLVLLAYAGETRPVASSNNIACKAKHIAVRCTSVQLISVKARTLQLSSPLASSAKQVSCRPTLLPSALPCQKLNPTRWHVAGCIPTWLSS